MFTLLANICREHEATVARLRESHAADLSSTNALSDTAIAAAARVKADLEDEIVGLRAQLTSATEVADQFRARATAGTALTYPSPSVSLQFLTHLCMSVLR